MAHKMTRWVNALPIVVWAALTFAPVVVSQGQNPYASVRAELERRYAENAAVFMKWDVREAP